jgi:hypothetical protein
MMIQSLAPEYSFQQNKKDGKVNSPISALSFILRHCGVPKSTHHSSGIARLDLELFTLPSQFRLIKNSSKLVVNDLLGCNQT